MDAGLLDERKRTEARRIFQELLQAPGVVGVRLMDRTGKVILFEGVDYGQIETFGALTAMMHGGGDFVFSKLGFPGDVRILAKTDHHTIHVCDVSTDLVMATIVQDAVAWESVQQAARSARAKVMGLLGSRLPPVLSKPGERPGS